MVPLPGTVTGVKSSSHFQFPALGVYCTHRDQAADSPGSVGEHRHDPLNVLGARKIRGDDEAHLALAATNQPTINMVACGLS